MKPILFLDPEMPKTHMVPANDPNGKLFNEYYDLCLDLQFADPEFPERIEAAKQKVIDFRTTHIFVEAPLIKVQTVLLGAGAAMRGYGKKRVEIYEEECKPTPSEAIPSWPEKSYLTHPDNVATLEPEKLAVLDVRPMKTHAEYMKDWGLS